jgi:hypothetical protein
MASSTVGKYKRFQSICLLELPKAHQSHINSLHRRKQVSKRCLNHASGVRYTDGHYTCSTADIRALRAAGYDSSSSRQTIRYQRRCSAVQRRTAERLQPDARHVHFACSPSSPPPLPASFHLSFCESSYNLRRQLFHAPAA